jgi:hypothetical protein
MRYVRVEWVSCLLIISAGCSGPQAIPDHSQPVRQSLTRVAEALEGVKDEASATRAEEVLSTERKALQSLSPLPAPSPPDHNAILKAENRALKAVVSLQKRATAGRVAGEKELDKHLDSILDRVRDYLKELDRVTGGAKAGDAGKPGE